MKFLIQNRLSIISFVIMIGIMGTRPLVSLMAFDLGASPIEIGLIVALFPFLPFLFAIQMGQYVDRLGFKIPIIFSSFFCSVSLIIPYFVESLHGLYISQIIGGVMQTIFVISAQTMAGKTAEASIESRDKNIMKFSIGVALGSFVGPLIGGVASDQYGYPMAFGVLGLIAIFSTFFSVFLPKTLISIEKNITFKPSIFNSLNLLNSVNVRRAFMISILILLGKDIYIAYFPLLALEFGLNNQQIGLIISVNAAAGILIRWSIPKLLTFMKRSSLIVYSIFLSGVCMILLPFLSDWYTLLFLSFILGLGLGIGQPLSISTTIMYLPENRIGEGLGLRLSANRMTQALAPLGVGLIAEVISMSGVFWFVGAIVVLGSKGTRTTEGTS